MCKPKAFFWILIINNFVTFANIPDFITLRYKSDHQQFITDQPVSTIKPDLMKRREPPFAHFINEKILNR